MGKGGSGKGASFLEREREERKKDGGERERKVLIGTERENQSETERAATEIFEKKAIRDCALRLPDANERLGIETQN